jgi:predicted transcriptional regulator
MDTARDDVAFLARSENRVDVLATFGPEAISRPVLQETAGVERVTLGRILGDFEDRGWVEKTGGEYALTPLGEMVAGDFEHLLTTVRTARKLESVVRWLPTDEMAFDLRHLGGADITLPTRADPAAPTRVAGQRLRATADVRLLMSVVVAEVVEACASAVASSDQRFEAVFTPAVLETIVGDPTMAARAQAMMASEDVAIYRTDGEVPHIMGLLDDVVAFGVTDDENLPRAYLETSDATVREWAESTYERHRASATLLQPSDLADAVDDGLSQHD